jgi:hypothetical protein
VIRFHSTLVLALALALNVPGHAQEKPDNSRPEKPSPPPLTKTAPVVPLKVQILLSRYQGDRKTSSQPYTLWANANDRDPSNMHLARTSLRMGAEVPLVTKQLNSGDSAVQYRPVGTNVDCTASTVDDGRYRLELFIEDTSVYGDDQSSQGDVKRAGGFPAFRTFRSTDVVILRDGQSAQYTTAADKVSGEVVKVDVTVNVIK